jgi:hypothetical protein
MGLLKSVEFCLLNLRLSVNSSPVTEVLDHVSKHAVPSEARTVLFVVHPYFPLIEVPDNTLSSGYIDRLEELIGQLDPSKVRTVLVEDPFDYFKFSHRLVEGSKVSAVFLTYPSWGNLLQSEQERFRNSIRDVDTAYVSGCYGDQCAFEFARDLQHKGSVNVKPVGDLLFVPHPTPGGVLSLWTDRGLAHLVGNAVDSRALVHNYSD